MVNSLGFFFPPYISYSGSCIIYPLMEEMPNAEMPKGGDTKSPEENTSVAKGHIKGHPTKME